MINMGGTTIVVNGKTVEDVLRKIKKAILNCQMTMRPDSDVVLYNPSTKEGKIFKPVIKYSQKGEGVFAIDVIEDVCFEEVESGNIGMPVAVASIYGKKPKEGEWQGAVHLHT